MTSIFLRVLIREGLYPAQQPTKRQKQHEDVHGPGKRIRLKNVIGIKRLWGVPVFGAFIFGDLFSHSCEKVTIFLQKLTFLIFCPLLCPNLWNLPFMIFPPVEFRLHTWKSFT